MSRPATDSLPDDEPGRLRTLAGYRILASEPEEAFDLLVRHAKHVFDVPIVAISFVAADHQFFKARVGLDVCSTDRDGSFCTHAIRKEDVLVVPDASADPRFRNSPWVIGEPGIRFYAGAPLVAEDGHAIGSFCIKDTRSRHDFGPAQQAMLRDLAAMAMERLEARRAAIAADSSRRRFDAVAGASADAIVCADGANRVLTWNTAAERMFGYPAEMAISRSLSMIVPPRMRAMHEAGFAAAIRGEPTRLIGSLVTVSACRRDGTEFPIELSLSHWTEAGEHRFGAIIRDITDRVEAETRLQREASFDPLTGLANRRALEKHIASIAGRQAACAVLLFDLDGFKEVNDSLGHAAGDAVLRVVAGRLEALATPQCLTARLGGDEFVAVLEDCADPLAAAALGNAVIREIEQPIEVGERGVYIGASCGVALGAGGRWDVERLMADADLALYRAKSEGKQAVRLFTPDLRPLERSRVSLTSSVRQAWERGEFELYYQPQVRLADGAVVGAEALIRWNHPERGVLSPAAFLSTIEEGLLAVPVSEWILRTACAQAALWQPGGGERFRMGVNLFAAQFRASGLSSTVQTALRDFGLAPEALELEITENTILRNEGRIAAILEDLRRLGVGIAFDDYGTGYASLTMLREFPVSRLKIDRSFVSDLSNQRSAMAVIEAVARLAEGFELEVIAEGIETPAQAEFVRRHCPEGQGYLFGRPVPAAEFEARFLVANEPLVAASHRTPR
ncbi:putative bifunctional diguanylate cyclase/phosphodiesterase [Aureimonas jatrophae]|uniref:PAS domain S-box-containing protein/diguanylate cyclase (GGDEF) domain-containing protein n=1 Tax=Aureimonas jatrophae TaxID=1166073 RepID=A0A1H0D1B4_9HYPH|nr:EAL domain-containing protein [Aureimonas jatrophae]MBB3949448.1 diguanylate cyclase (GGDEF)-like protein/PAS domain S-box-containing protein [Aureimonas jatrophae]SDN63954.1 PAS domain S-box-containing protein/diguanylate cyclase (GGDEF) domain-containing protein [Aureimonas jatrophae]